MESYPFPHIGIKQKGNMNNNSAHSVNNKCTNYRINGRNISIDTIKETTLYHHKLFLCICFKLTDGTDLHFGLIETNTIEKIGFDVYFQLISNEFTRLKEIANNNLMAPSNVHIDPVPDTTGNATENNTVHKANLTPKKTHYNFNDRAIPRSSIISRIPFIYEGKRMYENGLILSLDTGEVLYLGVKPGRYFNPGLSDPNHNGRYTEIEVVNSEIYKQLWKP